MRILSFKKEFKKLLLVGIKCSTLRQHKRPFKEGEIVQIYCPSPRSGHGKKLFNAKITYVGEQILWQGEPVSLHSWDYRHNFVNLIRAEGFVSLTAFKEWFNKHYDSSRPTRFFHYLFIKCVGGNVNASK